MSDQKREMSFEERVIRSEFGHNCQIARRRDIGDHKGCIACGNCNYGQGIETMCQRCYPCWIELRKFRAQANPMIHREVHSCSTCLREPPIRFCKDHREAGVCYIPALSKEAKKHLQSDLKDACVYCLQELLNNPLCKALHTGIDRAVRQYELDNEGFDVSVAPTAFQQSSDSSLE